MLHYQHWTDTETSLGYPAGAPSHGDLVAMVPLDWSHHVLQQIIEGVDVGVGLSSSVQASNRNIPSVLLLRQPAKGLGSSKMPRQRESALPRLPVVTLATNIITDPGGGKTMVISYRLGPDFTMALGDRASHSDWHGLSYSMAF